MKRFLGFVIKELRHIIRDVRTLVILVGMPISLILLFGYAVTNEIREAKIAILDLSQDIHSQSISNKILSSPYYQLEKNLQNESEIHQVFRQGKVKQVIVFEPEFGQKLEREGQAAIQILNDATDPNTASTLLNYSRAMVLDYQRSLQQGPGGLPMHLEISSRMRYNPELKGVFLFVPGLITIILMLVSAMMTSISITREKELGTMEVLLVSPMRPMQIILGKVMPYLLLSLLNASVILILGRFVFGVPIVGSLSLLMLETFIFTMASLALGILISTAAKTQQVALMASLMGLMLPTILLSGFMFPIENMPFILQILSNIVPAKWFIIIVKGIMLKGSGLAVLWKESLILVGFTLFFLVVSMKKFKVRLE